MSTPQTPATVKAAEINTLTLSAEVVGRLMLNGDCSQLTPIQRIEYYQYRCNALQLDPATHPFEYINLSGKLVLYAKAAVAQQLCRSRNLSTTIVSSYKMDDGTYVVQVRVTGSDGRVTDNIGAVSLSGLKGEGLCNALMKATTKAIRRAVLAHEGLGMLDETEVDSIEDTRKTVVSVEDAHAQQPAKVVDVVHPPQEDVKHEGKDTGEIEEKPAPKEDPTRYFTAVLDQLCSVAESHGADDKMLAAIRLKYKTMANEKGLPFTIKSMVDSMAKYNK